MKPMRKEKAQTTNELLKRQLFFVLKHAQISPKLDVKICFLFFFSGTQKSFERVFFFQQREFTAEQRFFFWFFFCYFVCVFVFFFFFFVCALSFFFLLLN